MKLLNLLALLQAASVILIGSAGSFSRAAEPQAKSQLEKQLEDDLHNVAEMMQSLNQNIMNQNLQYSCQQILSTKERLLKATNNMRLFINKAEGSEAYKFAVPKQWPMVSK